MSIRDRRVPRCHEASSRYCKATIGEGHLHSQSHLNSNFSQRSLSLRARHTSSEAIVFTPGRRVISDIGLSPAHALYRREQAHLRPRRPAWTLGICTQTGYIQTARSRRYHQLRNNAKQHRLLEIGKSRWREGQEQASRSPLKDTTDGSSGEFTCRVLL